MSTNDSPLDEKKANKLFADERVELLETIKEIVAHEVDCRLKEKTNSLKAASKKGEQLTR